MPIDVSILSQFKPQQPEPLLNTLAQFETIRGARQQQEMNALQMQRAKREFAEQDFVNKLYEDAMLPGGAGVDYDLIEARAAGGGYGGLVPKIRKQRLEEQKLRSEQEKEQLLKDKTRNELESSELEHFKNLLPTVKSEDQLKALLASTFTNPTLKQFYARMGVTETAALENLEKDLSSKDLQTTVAEMAQRTEDVRKGMLKQTEVSGALARAKSALREGTSSESGDSAVPGSTLDRVLSPEVQVGYKVADRIAQLNIAAEIVTNRGYADYGKELLEAAKNLQDQHQSMFTSAIKEYLFAQQNRGFEAFNRSQRAAGASSVNVGIPPQEKAEQTARGALLVKQYDDVRNRAKVAQRNLQNSAVLERVLNSGFETGFTAPIKREAARVLGALGVSAAEDFATNAQVFQAKVSEQVFGLQSLQAGPQTNQDFQRLNETYANITNTTEANKFIIATVRAQAEMAAAEKKFYDDWHKKHKTYDGADAAWDEGPGNKSIFDYPSMKPWTERPKRPAAPTAPAGPRGAPRSGTKPDPAQFFPR